MDGEIQRTIIFSYAGSMFMAILGAWKFEPTLIIPRNNGINIFMGFG